MEVARELQDSPVKERGRAAIVALKEIIVQEDSFNWVFATELSEFKNPI